MNSFLRNNLCRIFFSVIFVVFFLICGAMTFPNNEEVMDLVSKNDSITDRVPFQEIENCPEDMWLYRARKGNETIEICDCVRGYLYFPLNDTCHEAYKQGPCQPGEYFGLLQNDTVSNCVENPCSTNGMVPYKGSCYHLGMVGGPCGPNRTFEVKRNYKLGCSLPFSPTYSIIDTPELSCPPGSRRNSLGICRLDD